MGLALIVAACVVDDGTAGLEFDGEFCVGLWDVCGVDVFRFLMPVFAPAD